MKKWGYLDTYFMQASDVHRFLKFVVFYCNLTKHFIYMRIMSRKTEQDIKKNTLGGLE